VEVAENEVEKLVKLDVTIPFRTTSVPAFHPTLRRKAKRGID
jgi:hypothetical protein